MNREFDRVDAALASSAAGRALMFLDEAVRSAWRSSSTGAMTRSIGSTLRVMSAPTMIRTIAMAVFIAASVQPLLISAMPAAVMPAMPWAAFALVAVFALVTAWRAEAIVKAWPHSALARAIGR